MLTEPIVLSKIFSLIQSIVLLQKLKNGKLIASDVDQSFEALLTDLSKPFDFLPYEFLITKLEDRAFSKTVL